MRRLALILAVALAAGACSEALPESTDWSPAVIDTDVVLWRLGSGPAGFLGVGGPVTPDELEDPTQPLAMRAYLSGDGLVWEETFVFGETTGPVFSLATSAERYAVAGSWIDGPAVYTSLDGSDWSRHDLPSPPGGSYELEPAGIADDGSVLLVTGVSAATISPVAWVLLPQAWVPEGSDPITLLDTDVFGASGRLTAVAAGPGGFVAALQSDPDAQTPLPALWQLGDEFTWEPVFAPFPEDMEVTGLIGGETGYTALVAEDGDSEAFEVWTSPDGADWRERATHDTVFDFLDGKSGALYDALTVTAAGAASDSRPIAFSFNGFWLEIPAAYDGSRFVAVAVAADDTRRVASGITGSGSGVTVHVLVADP